MHAQAPPYTALAARRRAALPRPRRLSSVRDPDRFDRIENRPMPCPDDLPAANGKRRCPAGPAGRNPVTVCFGSIVALIQEIVNFLAITAVCTGMRRGAMLQTEAYVVEARLVFSKLRRGVAPDSITHASRFLRGDRGENLRGTHLVAVQCPVERPVPPEIFRHG